MVLKGNVATSCSEDFCEAISTIVRYLFIIYLFIHSFISNCNNFCFPCDDQRFVIQSVIWRPKFHLKLSLDSGVLLL